MLDAVLNGRSGNVGLFLTLLICNVLCFILSWFWTTYERKNGM